jgi:hypothetical protein
MSFLINSFYVTSRVNGMTRADNTTKGTDINKQYKFVLQYHIILFSPRHVSTLSSHHQVFYM